MVRRGAPGQKAFVTGFILSLEIGIAATAIGLMLGIPASRALMRHRIALGGGINTLLLMPLVMPGIVLGAAIYVCEIEAEIATGWPIIGSLAGLIAAHTLVVVSSSTRTCGHMTINGPFYHHFRDFGGCSFRSRRRG